MNSQEHKLLNCTGND